MKKVAWLTVLTALVLLVGSIGAAHGEIIPPSGMGQIGYEAVVRVPRRYRPCSRGRSSS